MRPDALPDLADRLRTLADRLDTEGPKALQRADDWRPGPRPGDSHETPPQPGDPDYTGPADELDQVLADDELDTRRGEAIAARIHTRLTHTLDELDRTQHHLGQLLDLLAAKHPPRGQLTPANAGDGWCRSCYRDAAHLEPIATQPDGTPRYRDLCRFCGEWAKAHDGDHPPVGLLRDKHAGKRMTKALIDRHLTRS